MLKSNPPNHLRQSLGVCISLFIVLLVNGLTVSQTTNTSGRGVVRIRVRVKEGDATKGLARKRFFLVRGGLEQNRSWVGLVEQQTSASRDCYYRNAGASEQLIQWLNENDCESVYCREIRSEEVEGPNAVPEFQKAVQSGLTEFKSGDLARKWITVNLPANLRDGFYRSNQEQLQKLLTEVQKTSNSAVQSVMTDRNGTAYFTDLEPGTYVLTNLLPAQTTTSFLSWNCELQVKPGDLATERPYLISNRKDKTVKCVAVEKPLPVCPATAP